MSKFANSSQRQSGSGFSDIFPVVKQVDNISTISQDHLTSTSSPATHLNVLRYHQQPDTLACDTMLQSHRSLGSNIKK